MPVRLVRDVPDCPTMLATALGIGLSPLPGGPDILGAGVRLQALHERVEGGAVRLVNIADALRGTDS